MRIYVRRSLAQRFWPKVNKDGPVHPILGTPCWPWSARARKRTPNGDYGRIFNRRGASPRVIYAHRVAWELTNGPLADGEYVFHRCDNPPCCNPSHLFKGTYLDNNRDMTAKGRHAETRKTHCPQNHVYSPENTRMYRGHRYCRACLTASNTLRAKKAVA